MRHWMGIQEPKALLTCENCLVDFDYKQTHYLLV